jgi:hypothetical protein
MNGFMRMAVDNGVLSGNLLIEVDETNLVPGQDLSVYPGKIFRRQGGAPGQAIFGTKYPNVSSENMQLFDKARQLADESTGLPSFAHGQTGITLAPFAKFQYIIREIAKALDLDPDKVTNNMDEAALQAELMKGFQTPMPQQQDSVAGANPADPTGAGGGTIGTGQVPLPQEQGFTGNEQPQGTPQQAQAVGQQ